MCHFHSDPAELRLVKNILGVQQMQSRNSSKPDKGPWPLRTCWFPVMGILSPALASGQGGGVGCGCKGTAAESPSLSLGVSLQASLHCYSFASRHFGQADQHVASKQK